MTLNAYFQLLLLENKERGWIGGKGEGMNRKRRGGEGRAMKRRGGIGREGEGYEVKERDMKRRD